jgi:predicted enzyme related to lactoylglutathione lyase
VVREVGLEEESGIRRLSQLPQTSAEFPNIKGVWMSIWVDDVDEAHKQCVAAGLEVTFPPTNMPWNVREMHLRHPDGHVFQVSRGNERQEGE